MSSYRPVIVLLLLGYHLVIVRLLSGYRPVIVVLLLSSYCLVIIWLLSGYRPIVVRFSFGYLPVIIQLCASPSNSLISLSFSKPAFSANAFGLFFIQALIVYADFNQVKNNTFIVVQLLRACNYQTLNYLTPISVYILRDTKKSEMNFTIITTPVIISLSHAAMHVIRRNLVKCLGFTAGSFHLQWLMGV